MDGLIPLEEARRRAKARNQGAEPGHEFSEFNPPPVNSEDDYGADAISAGEPNGQAGDGDDGQSGAASRSRSWCSRR